jgi:flagellar motor switch protein FliG
MNQAASLSRSDFNGGVKAALMLLCIGKPMASRLVKHLNRKEVAALVRSAKRIKHVSRQEIDAMIDSFSELYGQGVKFLGTEEEVLDLLGEIVPDGIDDLLSGIDGGEQVQAETTEPLSVRLRAVPVSRMVAFLQDEPVQFAAAVLDTLDREQASQVIEELPRDRRIGILRRMLVVSPLKWEASELLEKIVTSAVLGEDETALTQARKKQVAGIVNAMRDEVAQAFVEDLRAVEPEQATILDSMLFKFSDLSELDDDALAMIASAAGMDDMTNALVGVDGGLRDRLLGSMSARAKRMIESELASRTSVDEAAVLASRKTISALVLEMIEDGRIRYPADAAQG